MAQTVWFTEHFPLLSSVKYTMISSRRYTRVIAQCLEMDREGCGSWVLKNCSKFSMACCFSQQMHLKWQNSPRLTESSWPAGHPCRRSQTPSRASQRQQQPQRQLPSPPRQPPSSTSSTGTPPPLAHPRATRGCPLPTRAPRPPRPWSCQLGSFPRGRSLWWPASWLCLRVPWWQLPKVRS